LTVNFTNISAGVYSSTLWTFGDGDTSASTNVIVSYTYTNSGTYSVSLIVSNSLGNFSTVTLTNAVTASAPITLTIGPGDGGNLQLSWTNVPGLLLQATNLLGPWVTNTGATSPFRVAPTNGQMYYRLEVP
jgi:PKD repeat protein